MLVNSVVFEIVSTDSSEGSPRFLGTAFPVAPNGGLLTCRHVVSDDDGVRENLAVSDKETGQIVPIGHVALSKDPRMDIAFIPNALKRKKKDFFPILKPDSILIGDNVFSIGYYVADSASTFGYFKGNIVNISEETWRFQLTSLSLSYAIIEGLSGSPVITYHNGPKVLGLCYGNVQSRISAHEILEYRDKEIQYQETVTRIVELGQAHHANILIGFLEEIDAQGYIVTTEGVPGLSE